MLGKILLMFVAVSVVVGDVALRRKLPLESLFNRTRMAEMERTADGGEGEFTKLCALKGYYQFSTKGVLVSSPCQQFPAQLLVHFYQRSGACVADLAYVSFDLQYCAAGLASGPIIDGLFQHFAGTSSTLVDIEFVVTPLSQSRPILNLYDSCCSESSPMVGTPVEDVNVAGLRNCDGANALNMIPC